MKRDLIFNWRLGDYALIACPKTLARFNADDPNETIDFVKYYRNGDKEFRYSIGYFYWNSHEPCWEFMFVGERFCEIESEDIVPIWEMLKAAYKTLEAWKAGCEDEE